MVRTVQCGWNKCVEEWPDGLDLGCSSVCWCEGGGGGGGGWGGGALSTMMSAHTQFRMLFGKKGKVFSSNTQTLHNVPILKTVGSDV